MIKFLENLSTKRLDLASFYEEGQTFDEYCEAVYQGIDQEEIIYYNKALEYLRSNDPGLQYSIKLASDHGYNLENINSELLATLLYQDELSEEFSNNCDEIVEEFNKL